MIRRLILRLWHGEEILNDSNWRHRCNQAAIAVAIVGILCTVQTMVIYSPAFLIDALYHGREHSVPTLRAKPTDQREKLLYRLCWVRELYAESNYTDQYMIETPENCPRPD